MKYLQSIFILSFVLLIGCKNNIEVQETSSNSESTVPDTITLAKAAVEEAEIWLKLLDKNNYNSTWQNSATLLKMAISPKDWAVNMSVIKESFGEFEGREFVDQKYFDQLSTLPEGNHYVFHFQTKYSEIDTILETVTVTQEQEEWKVVGYFVNPKGK